MRQLLWRHEVLLLLLFLSSWFGYAMLSDLNAQNGVLADRHRLTDIAIEADKAAIAPMPESIPSDAGLATLRLCEGSDAFETIPNDSWRVVYWLKHNIKLRFSHWSPVAWDCGSTSAGGSSHAEIRNIGAGRFDVSQGYIRFSSTAGGHPADGQRSYALVTPSASGALILAALLIVTALTGVLSAVVFLTKRVGPWFVDAYRSKGWFQSLTASVGSTVIILAVLFAAAEMYLRLNVPFTEAAWPSRFDPKLGVVFEPNAEVAWTNHAEFWTRERTNSLGFLDREPVVPKPADTFRLLFVGDSFVEAAQIPHENKTHVLLEQTLNETLDGTYDTVALGYSGTGQSNQLPFVEQLGAQLEPDLIVLMFVWNDFANNSAVLESVRYGIDPYHPPRLFFEPVNNEPARRIDIAADWEQHRLGGDTDMAANQRRLFDRYPALGPLFGDWLLPDPVDIDRMIYVDNLPPVFSQAIAATEVAIGQHQKLAAELGAELLLVITDSVTLRGEFPSDARAYKGHNAVDRLQGICTRLAMQCLNLFPVFVDRGDMFAPRYLYDPHWNEQGHRWAAEAIAAYLIDHPELL